MIRWSDKIRSPNQQCTSRPIEENCKLQYFNSLLVGLILCGHIIKQLISLTVALINNVLCRPMIKEYSYLVRLIKLMFAVQWRSEGLQRPGANAWSGAPPPVW